MNLLGYIPLALYLIAGLVAFRAGAKASLRKPAFILAGLAVLSTFAGLLYRLTSLFSTSDRVPSEERASFIAACITEAMNCTAFALIGSFLIMLVYWMGQPRNR